jgi:hypothetical protein
MTTNIPTPVRIELKKCTKTLIPTIGFGGIYV